MHVFFPKRKNIFEKRLRINCLRIILCNKKTKEKYFPTFEHVDSVNPITFCGIDPKVSNTKIKL